MIRQAISCDICGSEKRQTNHWFVAHEQGDELRVTGWNSRNRLRPGSKHLCGQTCLHKLVDEFVARTLDARGPIAAEESADRVLTAETSLTSELACHQAVASICLQPPAPHASAPPKPVSRPIAKPIPKSAPTPIQVRLPPELAPSQLRPQSIEELLLPEDLPRYASSTWRAEAWNRERERELRTAETRPGLAARRRFTG